ncbi:hypothetical protein RD792_010538 [Penstemon davidsonii]|uniref:Protein TIC 22-like, chloroplastic n=1 Tax=Penstemon davidsonii TaxID=160366 RepID=A0ABR0D255_9LAMI|nr:hypothetical protein RD792_010538 [Penstemon davidsonii]
MAAPSSPPHNPFHQAITSFQTHFSNFFDNLPKKNPLKNPPFFAKISNDNNTVIKPPISSSYSKSNSNSNGSLDDVNYAMSEEEIEERLAGVPVYALSNGSREFVLVSGTNTGKNLGLFCFSEADADTLLKQMKSVDPSMSSDSQVVPVALSKIFQLKVDGVALRLVPEVSQIKNALKERKRTTGVELESFPGVPVFQSRSLILRSQNKRYRPVFFRKEDLEKSLSRASIDQKQLNPRLRGDIQVEFSSSLPEHNLDSHSSLWDDVVFVPPGFDVSTDLSRQN